MRDFSWIAQSRKAQVALGAVVSIVLVRVLRRVGLSDQDAHDVVAAVLVIGATWIGSIAIEDHGEKQKSEVRVQSSATSIDQQNAVSRPSGGPDGAAAGGAAAP